MNNSRMVWIGVFILLFMFDVEVAPSWINFHSESRDELLWSYGYHGMTQFLNGHPYYGAMLFPLSAEHLDIFGRGLVFYYKTLDSKYQNVTYWWRYQTYVNNTAPDEFSLSVFWTYDGIFYDTWHLIFVVLCNIAVFCLLWRRIPQKHPRPVKTKARTKRINKEDWAGCRMLPR